MLCHHLRGGVDWNFGIWIDGLHFGSSPPAWWCGLKLYHPQVQVQVHWSPPAWWCGLKSYRMPMLATGTVVTTCVVVWIEISLKHRFWPLLFVTTCVVVWIEIPAQHTATILLCRHHLRGGVDWNSSPPSRSLIIRCHHLRGGVDWNISTSFPFFSDIRHHLRGGVDWNTPNRSK